MPNPDVLRKIIERSPKDPFPRYGLAMELKNRGQHDDAQKAFAELEAAFPDYVPQYLMHAQLLVTMTRRDDAKAVLERGIPIANKKGDGHAAGELQGTLDSL